MIELANQYAIEQNRSEKDRIRSFRLSGYIWGRHLIQPRHVLAAIALGPKGVGYHAILACGANPDQIAVLACNVSSSTHLRDHKEKLPLDHDTERLVVDAIHEASALGHDWVGTEHFLLAFFRSKDRKCRRALKVAEITAENVQAFIRSNGAQ